MHTNIKTHQPSLLILADFSDGSWNAASFAMQFLYRQKSRLSILQTYENPGWGHFMMRKLSFHLKKIAKTELGSLKRKLSLNFNIKKQKINTLLFEGSLNDVLHYPSVEKGQYTLVLSTFSSFNDSCTRQNRRLKKIINTAQNPLYLLPRSFDGDQPKKILLVSSGNKNLSEQVCRQLTQICRETRSKLEVLFILKGKSQIVPKQVKAQTTQQFAGINVSFNTICSKNKCKGIELYLKNSLRDLIVIEND